MTTHGKVMIVGLGEIGKPLLNVISRHHKTVRIDVTPPAESVGEIDVMHVCYPFEIDDFVGETAPYMKEYQPRLTVINSTVSI